MITKVLLTEFVTHNVKRFIIEKPRGYQFTPGQATDMAINKPGWQDKKHAFTFTSLNEDKVLEFTIKGYPKKLYPDHEGMTELLHQLKPGDELIIDEPWGTINYHGTGVFVAGGAGITPFIAILRHLNKNNELLGNKLIFSNRTSKDVILEPEFRHMFAGADLVLTLTQEEKAGYEKGRIDERFLKKHVTNFSQNFYLCGPLKMVSDLRKVLAKLGARTDSIVFEK